MMSLILRGDKSLTPEQATEIGEYLGLTEGEADYFSLMVDFERAGTHKLKARLRKKIQVAQVEAKKISKRALKDVELTEQTKAIFYSDWIFTGIRNLSAIDGMDDVPHLAKKLGLPPKVVARAVDFLLENGLCRKTNGKLSYGPAHTHLELESPFLPRHHQNWRLKAFESMSRVRDEDLFFTSPMSLSVEAAAEIRKLLPSVIEKVFKIVGPSPSEKAYCLNIDWFEY